MKCAQLCILGVCGALTLQTAPASADMHYANVRGWRISYSDEYVGCIATGSYQDGTSVRIGFDGIIRKPFINFSNARWSAYPLGQNYELAFEAGSRGKFTGYFHTRRRDGLPTFESGNINEDFIDAFAAANAMRILVEGAEVTRIPLTGTRAAVRVLADCQRDQ